MTDFRPLAIRDVVEITPTRHGDARGYFMETYSQARFAEHGCARDWVQDNQSRSERIGVLRGLHFQVGASAQTKLVRVLRGAVFDVAVDLRRASPDYGRWVAATLSADAANQLFIPAGFAHGFLTLEPGTEIAYKVDQPYAPADERALRWDDPALAIAWPTLDVELTLSDRDRDAPRLAALDLAS